jgi:hypothetical protein
MTATLSQSEQLRKLLDGYVTDRNTLESISVPANASYTKMLAIAAEHDLLVSVTDGEVRLADPCYTYAVRDGDVQTIAG